MKQPLSILLFGIIAIISTISPIFAENYYYKLYNPKTKESFPAEMITISTSNDTYIIGLSKAMIMCEITTVGHKENNLLSGKCIDIKNSQIYYWKEFQPNTFYPELKSIIEERKAQCKNLDNSAYHLLPNNFESQNPYSNNNSMPPYWNSYMKELTRRIKMNWSPPQSDKSKSVVVMIKIAKDGRLLSCKVFKSSGIQKADSEAIRAVELTAPFKPLPSEFEGQNIDIQFTFDYNVHQLPKRFPEQVTYQEEPYQKEIQHQEQKNASKFGGYSSYAERNKYVSEKIVAIYDKRSPAYGYRYVLYSPIGKYVGHNKIMQPNPNGYSYNPIPDGGEGSSTPCFKTIQEAKHYYYPQWY